MKITKNNPFFGVGAGFAVLAAFSGLHAATLIHNDGFTTNNLALPGDPNYGSNVSASGNNWTVTVGAGGFNGTPDIALIWDGESGGSSGNGFDTYIAWNTRGNVIQLDSSAGGTQNFYISFVPGANFGVIIDSFDLDAWAGGGNMTVNWFIRDSTHGGNVLDSGTWTKDNAGGRDTISPGYTGNIGQTLVLHFDRETGNGIYLAMDNLSFDQIPEPATAALAGLALGAMAMRRRRA